MVNRGNHTGKLLRKLVADISDLSNEGDRSGRNAALQ